MNTFRNKVQFRFLIQKIIGSFLIIKYLKIIPTKKKFKKTVGIRLLKCLKKKMENVKKIIISL